MPAAGASATPAPGAALRIGPHTVRWRGDRIELLRDGVVVASARWIEGRATERRGRLTEGGDEDAAWWELEAEVRRAADAQVAEATASAYDARGVDVTQIDRMLSLTPGERLQALEAHRRSIALLLGDAPRH